MELEKLDPDEIVKTARTLRDRISERFPGAGLVEVADQLVELASRAKRTSIEIRTPNVKLRVISYALIAFTILASIAAAVVGLGVETTAHVTWAERIQTTEAAINDLVLLGAAIYFVMHLETRMKRGRIVKALHELRTLSHLIDVHQLTKSPEIAAEADIVESTKSSPKRTLTPFLLGRYLDYCTELLSLTGKIAALYGDGFDDAESIEAVNEVEELTIGLQTKIWQKIMLLRLSMPQSMDVLSPRIARESEPHASNGETQRSSEALPAIASDAKPEPQPHAEPRGEPIAEHDVQARDEPREEPIAKHEDRSSAPEEIAAAPDPASDPSA